MHVKATIVALAASFSLASAQINYGSPPTTTTAAAAAKAETTTSTSSAASSSASSGTHIIQVSNSAGTSFTFDPPSVMAAMGEQVQFQFWGLNHSVAQASFDKPCQPLTGGFFSGFFPLSAGATDRPTFTIAINDTKPIWFYCAQTILTHCQAGMVGAINPPSSGNTLDSFTSAAKKATSFNSTNQGEVQGGTVGTMSTSPSASGSSSAAAASPSSSSSSSAVSTKWDRTSSVGLLVFAAIMGVAALMC